MTESYFTDGIEGAEHPPTSVSCISVFADNYVWLIHGTAAERVAVVDPGEAGAVTAHLEAHGLELRAILITHHHADHTGGIADLVRRYEVPVFGPARHAYPGAVPVRDLQRVEVPGLDVDLESIEAPGHTIDHVAYRAHGAVFCGDTLFSAGCGRVIEGSTRQMWHSLSRLAGLPPATRVFAAHEYTLANLHFAAAVEGGNLEIARYRQTCLLARRAGRSTLPSTIRRELGINPFLRCAVPAVRFAAESRAGRRLGDAAEIFAVLRGWKDEFGASAAPAPETL